MMFPKLNTSIRFLLRHWRHLIINALGLSTGLYVFFLAISLQQHERQHDQFFADAERIFGVYTRVLPSAGFGTGRVYGAPPVIGPLLAENFTAVEASSRYVQRRQALRVGDFSAYESVKFVDPQFTEVFDFQALAGNLDGALHSGNGLIMTREAAMRYFGRVDAVGQSLRLAGSVDLPLMAVIEDLPSNSHFVYRFGTADRLQVIAPMEVLAALGVGDLLSDWGAVSDVNRLWLKLQPDVDPGQLEPALIEFLSGHVDESGERIVGGFSLLNLTAWNLSALDANGVSLITIAVVLCGFVLLVAALNYSNLFTAMIARRLRELAVRKTLGASRWQLSGQLFVECLLLTALAAALAFAVVAATLPALGAVVGKDIQLAALLSVDVLGTVLVVSMVTTLLSVSYPVFVVNRLATVRTLRGSAFRGRGGARLRFSLVAVQFTLNAILATVMATTYLQNQHLLTSDPGFNGDDVVILSGIGTPVVNSRLDVLLDRITRVPGVELVAGSSQHPYQEIHNQASYARAPDVDPNGLSLYRFAIGTRFLELYDIETLIGRSLSEADRLNSQSQGRVINVLLNREAVATLGYASPAAAIDQTFLSTDQALAGQTFRIIGVVEDANLLGLANDIKPSLFRLQPENFNYLSVRLRPEAADAALPALNRAWQELFPDVPVQSAFLEQTFRSRFNILAGINRVLMALSVVSILLAISGLFGLVSVLVQQRRRELAIRKVLGASLENLLRLLSWQFTRPVILALAIGAPLGMLAGGQYLNLFAERIDGAGPIAAAVALSTLLLAWLTVSGQIVAVARQNPTEELRGE